MNAPAPKFNSPKIFHDILWNFAVDKSHFFLGELNEPAFLKQLSDMTSPYILLPQLAHLRLPPRLSHSIENLKLPVLRRDVFQRLHNFVQSTSGLTYVYGPQGFGKSFALYHLFCALSANPQNRVLYIPNCGLLNGAPEDGYRELFIASLAAFSHSSDVSFLCDIEPLTNDLRNHPYESWRNLQVLIAQYCELNNYNYYAIFDQHNELDQDARVRPPTDLRNWLNYFAGPLFKLVISAPANDKAYQLTTETSALFPFYEGLSHQELYSWRTKHAFFPNDALDLLTELTANVPLELYEVLQVQKRVNAPTLNDLMREYHASRLSSLHTGHRKYLEEKGANFSDHPYDFAEHKCMLYMVNNLPIPDLDNLVFDRQLFFATPPDVNANVWIQPAFPMAREMVIKWLEPLDHEVLAASILGGHQLPNDAKYRMAKYYIVHCLFKHCRIYLPLKKVGTDVKAKDLDLHIETVRFHGLLPTTPPPDTPTLFVPSSPKYTDVDFLLFVPNQTPSYLYCFQVTVQEEPWRHINQWAKGNPIYDQWKTFCPDKTESSKVWFVSTPMGSEIQPADGAKKFLVECPEHLWVPFNDPKVGAYFPALKHFYSRDLISAPPKKYRCSSQ